ncbi:hypothetical protein AQUCO_00100772v1 [Aquilegia coerulea]|uniref:WDR11 TPR domain-containing protein n=1 Tax=Aquilegia coerulea TaxID=218851 RepID=A0A2G5FBV8_AQUCA|nr:hypothetical protein AQUCO_00100772v1 [Aquilegia coerulea]
MVQCNTTKDNISYRNPGTGSSAGDLRSYMIESFLPHVGDSVVSELLLKFVLVDLFKRSLFPVLGCILDDERAELYSTVVHNGSAIRFAFAAAVFVASCSFALSHLMNKLVNKPLQKGLVSSFPDLEDTSTLLRIISLYRLLFLVDRAMVACEQKELWESASECMPWHGKLEGEEAIKTVYMTT